jgi:hypothetical protein
MCISWTNKEFYIINARCNHKDEGAVLKDIINSTFKMLKS